MTTRFNRPFRPRVRSVRGSCERTLLVSARGAGMLLSHAESTMIQQPVKQAVGWLFQAFRLNKPKKKSGRRPPQAPPALKVATAHCFEQASASFDSVFERTIDQPSIRSTRFAAGQLCFVFFLSMQSHRGACWHSSLGRAAARAARQKAVQFGGRFGVELLLQRRNHLAPR